MQNYIRQIRERRGLTLDNVSKSLGCTKAQISKLERGHIRLNDEWLDRLSRLFCCSVHDLIDDDIEHPCASNNPEEQQPAFATARLLGVIDSSQVGEVNYADTEQQYPIHFLPPTALSKLNERILYEAYTVVGDSFPLFPSGSQLIFASANNENNHFIKENSVVLCSTNENGGNQTSESVRVIAHNELGIPFAVFKKRKSRQHIVTLTSDILLGNSSASEALAMIAKAESDRPYRKLKKLPVPLKNQTIEIKSFLVKAITDRI